MAFQIGQVKNLKIYMLILPNLLFASKTFVFVFVFLYHFAMITEIKILQTIVV